MNEKEIGMEFLNHFTHVEDYLAALGVPENHIVDIKPIRIQAYPYERFLFDDLGDVANVIIPFSKVIGSNLFGNIGYKWFDLVKWSLEQNFYGNSPHLVPKRIRGCLSFLKVLGWEKWNQSYQTSDIGELYFSLLLDDKGHVIAYMHEDGKGGGRHRIFTGKVCGAEYVRAARLTQFRLNKQKLAYYQKALLLEQQIKILIETGELFHKEHHKNEDDKDCWVVTIINQDPFYNLSLGALFQDFNDFKTVKAFKVYYHTLKYIHQTLLRINMTISEQKHKHWRYRLYPQNRLKKRLKDISSISAYDEAFLVQDDQFLDDVKWLATYHFKHVK
ncbi:hypothetical protein [Staphylococcus aureus]|uniref:hypothetical protein n=1 Tax=Staphylococcus aureus TaxID=1280 RepID=UPI001CE198B0|nr:hypothetical protein [Staphylococcus aureus]MCA1235776.1 hypothetical protein [Staphylococcus aureus]